MIALGSDHGGFRLKEAIKSFLMSEGIEIKDFGPENTESVDYPDFAQKVGHAVVSKECELGILICGTGIGISIAANKINGVRAALCHDVFSAKATKEHNNANILCMGERVVGEGLALEIVKAFLQTPFSNDDRHLRRIKKITDYENSK